MQSPQIVHGAAAIAREINKDVKAVYRLLELGLVPGAFRMGRTWSLSLPRFRKAVHGDDTIAPLTVEPPTPPPPPSMSRKQQARQRKQRVAERARGGRA
jgi:hypothetical protein